MPAIVANESQLEEVGENIVSLIEEIAGHCNEIGSHVNEINGNWTDAAGNKFGSEYEAVQKEMPGYLEKGYAFAGFLKGAAKYVREARELSNKAVTTTEVQ